jgi:hypothetical protein
MRIQVEREWHSFIHGLGQMADNDGAAVLEYRKFDWSSILFGLCFVHEPDFFIAVEK